MQPYKLVYKHEPIISHDTHVFGVLASKNILVWAAEFKPAGWYQGENILFYVSADFTPKPFNKSALSRFVGCVQATK